MSLVIEGPRQKILVRLAQERGLYVSKYLISRLFSCDLSEVTTNKTMLPMQNVTKILPT
jgi:hypothetical protein